jgi:hypothetical protein
MIGRVPMIERVPAVGGTRTVPAPDPIARDYLRLVLRLDQHRPGLVDAYFGPADLKAATDMENLRPPGRLAEDAAALRDRLAAEVGHPTRRAWFEAQLVALEAQARDQAGEAMLYEDLVARLFDHRMPRLDDGIFAAAAAKLDAALPGAGTLDERLAAWDAPLTIPTDRVGVVAEHLAARFRDRAAADFGLPEGEGVRLSTVRDRPWSGYNWYEGGRHSRVEINLDLPVRVGDLVQTIAHETYPGHHLEGAIKEARLVDERGWTELTVMSINTPECFIREGLADLGYRFAVPSADEAATIEEAIRVAGLDLASDARALRAVAERGIAIGRARRVLRGISGNAALLRHADGRSHEAVVDYLVTVGHQSRERAEQRLRFIEHPLWRTYSFVYREGEALLGEWLDAVPPPDRTARFGRLLAEAIASATITAELAEITGLVGTAPTSDTP